LNDEEMAAIMASEPAEEAQAFDHEMPEDDDDGKPGG